MNHKNTTLAIVAIVAATALTAIPFAVPQQALAGGHHYKHNSNSIKVDQQINQLNNCSSSFQLPQRQVLATSVSQLPLTDCQNFGNNQADISK